MSNCLIWKGTIDIDGYGIVNTHLHKKYGAWQAHRAIWIGLYGQIPSNIIIRHLCNNRACYNPFHLRSGTFSDNRKDYTNTLKECPQGHPYDEENTYIRSNGGRTCRTCRRTRWR